MTDPDAGDARDAIEQRTRAVLEEPLYWFPVRHHSPAVARRLREAMLARRPELVLVEGPADATELVRHVVDPKTKPPIAIYSSYVDDDNVLGLAGVASPSPDIPARFASWYPLLAYSPEYVAMRTAREIGAAVVFVDLPHHALLRPRAADGAPPTEGEPRGARGWEDIARESSFYRELAEAAGHRNWDEAWDAIFEVSDRHPDVESFRRDLALFCCGVRNTTSPERMARDGTLERERHMIRAIRRELAARAVAPERAMVVCGGFHLFLDRDDPQAPPEPPRGTSYVTVTPYSYPRMSELAGYGAGNRAPRYYHTLYDADDPESAMVDHVVDTLARGRKGGDGLSSADAIAVAQHARMLAALRGRAHPALDDIRDALVTCCVKGRADEDGAHLLEAMAATEIGTAVGRVTPALGQLPFVHDFYAQIDALDLGEVTAKDKKLRLTLDLRSVADARRSAFLHRLSHLEIPMAQIEQRLDQDPSPTLLRERWRLAWTPGLEPALVEKNLYGDTVESAAIAKLEEELAKELAHAGTTCERLARSVAMDLPGLVHRLEDAVGAAIDHDTRFTSLADGLGHLSVLDRHASLKGLRRDVLADLCERCFARACFAIPDIASAPEDEQELVLGGLKALAELVLAGSADRALFVAGVASAEGQSTVPFLRGAFAGLLTEIRERSADDLAGRIAAFARARPEAMVEAGAFIDGAIAASRTSILLGADALVAALDELWRAASHDAFRTILPSVRHAFERLHARQTASLCDRVAARYGLGEGDALAKLETSVEVGVEIAAIDAKVAQIMKEWTF